MRLAAVLPFAFAALLTAQAEPVLAAAVARAGANGDELQQAWADVPAGQRASLRYLLQHMPDADAQALAADFLLRQVRQAHAARAAVPWGAQLADELFRDYVLPYAQANEPREDWRTDLAARFLPSVRECRTPGEAALRLNATVFDALGVHYSTGRARADQAPSASIAQGKATCTGLSILLACACRACCVPARLVSVRWPHQDGNHTWVEVWDGAAWRFVGADEPDPQGFDRAWFTGDAARCATADREHRIWAVSFAPTGARFAAGWGPDIELWGTDVSARYAAPQQPAGGDAALATQLDRFFAADAARQATFEFDRNLDNELRTPAGDARLRQQVGAAWRRAERATLLVDHEQHLVRAGDKVSPFTVKQVGEKPAGGWPLVIAMHGGGGAPKALNDSQWRHMEIYYRDHPEAGGYLYCALRAPTDEWNGFYTDYFYPLLERLIRQFVVCSDVDPDRVIAIGYSHGGYGAFAIGPKLPHRFAAVHASAAAPTDGETSPVGLHTLPFSFLVGGKDTAYGRRERCEAFDALLTELKANHPGLYPTQFTLVEGNGHTGLPDRDLLAQLVPKVRVALPKQLFWEPTDGVVQDHYWLHLPAPKKHVRVDAAIDGQKLSLQAWDEAALAETQRFALRGNSADQAADQARRAAAQQRIEVVGVQAWLDARLCDLDRPLEVTIAKVVGREYERDDGGMPCPAGYQVETRTQMLQPAPSLRTLCKTMQQRGDPVLAASWVVELR
ncbi:MAG: hypothetical protein JNM25_00080 [Planctomycetes bacterium]|nr:hypothetical protein [Planctomycetota bacterium]